MTTNLRSRLIVALTIIVFLVCLGFGFWLAGHKTLWNDEISSHVGTVTRGSYWDIFLIVSFNSVEGNTCPLFYLVQRAITDLTRYQLPFSARQPLALADLKSQLILRINPNIFMSLSIAAVFYFFFRYYSFVAAIYSFWVFVSSYMVLVFWAEARPYALWVFLTTVQCLLFLTILKEEREKRSLWRWLMGVHVLLSLTIVFSAFQILGVSLLLWFLKNKSWRRYIFMTVVPAAICVFYYVFSAKFQFWFEDGPLALFSASFPKDRVLIILLYAIGLGLYYVQKKIKSLALYDKHVRWEGGGFLAFTVLMVLAAVFVLAVLKIKEAPPYVGFQVSNRYFIYLAPISSIAVSFFSIEMVRAAKGRPWLRAGIVLLLVGLLVWRMSRSWELALPTYHFFK